MTKKWLKIAHFSKLARLLQCSGQSATNRGTYEGQVSGSMTMTNHSNSVREISQLMSAAIAALLFGSTMILSAVGPARASETPILAAHDTPATLRYLA
jgi:hypothetical protein